MSANQAPVNSLEVLYDSFQDYVKNSLIVLIVGVGTVLLVIGYLFKMLNSCPGDVKARRSRSRRRRSSTSSNQSNSSGHTKCTNHSNDQLSSHSKRHRQGSHSNTSVQSFPICCEINKNGKTISSTVSSCPSYRHVERKSRSNIVTASNNSICMPSCSTCCSDCIHCLPQMHVCPSSKSHSRKSSPGSKEKKHLIKSRQSSVKLTPPNSCCSMCKHDADRL